MKLLFRLLVIVCVTEPAISYGQAAPAAPPSELQQSVDNTLLPIIVGVAILGAAWVFGKVFAALLKDDHRKIVGGALVIVIGAALAIYGIASINSTSSRLASSLGEYDTSAIISIAIGAFLAIVGFVTLMAKERSSGSAIPASPTKKCQFCAETIQFEAKLCRFCGKSLDSPSTTT